MGGHVERRPESTARPTAVLLPGAQRARTCCRAPSRNSARLKPSAPRMACCIRLQVCEGAEVQRWRSAGGWAAAAITRAPEPLPLPPTSPRSPGLVPLLSTVEQQRAAPCTTQYQRCAQPSRAGTCERGGGEPRQDDGVTLAAGNTTGGSAAANPAPPLLKRGIQAQSGAQGSPRHRRRRCRQPRRTYHNAVPDRIVAQLPVCGWLCAVLAPHGCSWASKQGDLRPPAGQRHRRQRWQRVQRRRAPA